MDSSDKAGDMDEGKGDCSQSPIRSLVNPLLSQLIRYEKGDNLLSPFAFLDLES